MRLNYRERAGDSQCKINPEMQIRALRLSTVRSVGFTAEATLDPPGRRDGVPCELPQAP